MFGLGTTELMILGVVAVLLFGSRLPEVARSMGKSLTEFKKGMQGFENEIHSSVDDDPTDSLAYENDYEEPSSPAFEPPESDPSAGTARVKRRGGDG